MNAVRKWSRIFHRDLSFFFSGLILIYAISGIALNHKDSFNSNYIIRQKSFYLEEEIPRQSEVNKEWVINLLKQVNEEDAYTKHYFPRQGVLKVFLKGGSSVVADLNSGNVVYESVKRRPLFSQFSQLHYNPGKWWTAFSDFFGVSLIIITLTGILMVKGKKGFWGRGGIELLAGILIPVIFLMFF